MNLDRLQRFVWLKLPDNCQAGVAPAAGFGSCVLSASSTGLAGGRRSCCGGGHSNTVPAVKCLHLLGWKVRLVPQSCIGDFCGVSNRCDRNRHISRHAGKELQIGVFEVDNRVVGNDILDTRRVHPDLEYDPVKHFLWEGVHLKICFLAWSYLPYIALISLGINLHLGQVERNCEERWRL